MKRVLVFTGGGIIKVLNSTLIGVVNEAKKSGIEVFGGIGGWSSLVDDSRFVDLTRMKIDHLGDIGGSFLRTSRVNPFKVPEGEKKVFEKIKKHKIDAVIAIGGNDTLGTAKKLHKKGLNVVGIPKTIDNDLSGTYFTPGFPSAAKHMAEYVSLLRRDAATSYHGIVVIESMGGHAGWLPASTIYGDADIIVPPEKSVDMDYFLKYLEDYYNKNNHYCVIVVSKEADFGIKGLSIQPDAYGQPLRDAIAISLKQEIVKKIKSLRGSCRAVIPGHIVSAGKPIEIDKKIAFDLGRESVRLVKDKKFGQMPNIVLDKKSKKLKIGSIKLDKVVGDKNYRILDESYFDFKNFRPKKKFLDYMQPILGKHEPGHKEYYKFLDYVYGHAKG